MKRAMTRKRHRPEEIVAKLREVDEALSQGKTLEDVAKSLGDYFANRLDIAFGQFGPWGFLDCDGDNDLDLVFTVNGKHLDGSDSEVFVGWLENTGFQHPASLEGDLNGDGHIDSADLGRLLGGYTG